MEVCHNDGDKENNRLTNLRWDTPKSNCYDKLIHGKIRFGKGNEKILTVEVIKLIKLRVSQGKSLASISRETGMHYTNIGDIRDGKHWEEIY